MLKTLNLSSVTYKGSRTYDNYVSLAKKVGDELIKPWLLEFNNITFLTLVEHVNDANTEHTYKYVFSVEGSSMYYLCVLFKLKSNPQFHCRITMTSTTDDVAMTIDPTNSAQVVAESSGFIYLSYELNAIMDAAENLQAITSIPYKSGDTNMIWTLIDEFNGAKTFSIISNGASYMDNSNDKFTVTAPYNLNYGTNLGDKVIIFDALYTKNNILYGVLKNAKYIYNKLIGTNALTKISAGGKNYIHLAGSLWLENQ